MKGLVIVGAILVLLGIIGLAIPVFQTSETKDVAKVGDLKLQTQETQSHVIPPIVAGGALVLGIVLIGAGYFRKG
jgi:hypothetical protein